MALSLLFSHIVSSRGTIIPMVTTLWYTLDFLVTNQRESEEERTHKVHTIIRAAAMTGTRTISTTTPSTLRSSFFHSMPMIFLLLATVIFAPPSEAFTTKFSPSLLSRRQVTLINASEFALASSLKDASAESSTTTDNGPTTSFWEDVAISLSAQDPETMSIEETKDFVQTVSLLRVGIPSLWLAASAKIAYPTVAITLANLINDSAVFGVVAADASQYIQNILTTSGLMFSILVGQTYYFMYQQQEAIYLALFDEVTAAKALIEQLVLVSQGRPKLYREILDSMQLYVHEDLTKFNDIEPAVILSARPADDPLEQLLYLTSVGEPSLVYQSVQELRRTRAYRLGALQRKLPQIQMILLWSLAGITLFTFPLLGAGVQTIGGNGILTVQSWYLGFLVFGMSLTMGVVNELRKPSQTGAYNAKTVLRVMVAGLEEELTLRMTGKIAPPSMEMEPSVDSDGYWVPQE
jgi:hypothetical protein